MILLRDAAKLQEQKGYIMDTSRPLTESEVRVELTGAGLSTGSIEILLHRARGVFRRHQSQSDA